MNISLFNSLSKNKELFEPLDPSNVTIYVCGPTVYNYPHLGNARSVVVYDLLFRLLKDSFPQVTYVRNITDIDDKINNAAKANKVSIKELAQKFTDIFHEDMQALNVLQPTFEPKATENITSMIDMIARLIENNNAYESNGHVFFNVSSYKEYGRLSNRNIDDLISGVRIDNNSHKKNPLDFVLWKPASENDDISAVFDSPWGKGRPGWHIECSAMSNKFLGKNFDIHGGGSDLKFPHHDNEIAQSCCSSPESQYAKYWVHNGFLTVNGEKMSKSLNNFITVRDLLDQKISGTVIRYLLLTTHYRKPLDFSQHLLEIAQKAIDKFYTIISQFPDDSRNSNIDEDNNYLKNIQEALSDDLNSPVAISILHNLVSDFNKEDKITKKSQLAYFLKKSLDFLGFYDEFYFTNFGKKVNEVDESYILQQIELRKEAKANKNWALSDKIRDDLLQDFGVVLEDKSGGEVSWKVK